MTLNIILKLKNKLNFKTNNKYQMNTLKIEIPEGFEVDNFNPKTGEVKFKKLPLKRIGRITTFEQVCEEMGENPSDYIVDTSLSPRKQGVQRLDRITLIIECFQNGAKLDVYNTKQYKHFGWFDVSKGHSGFRFDDSTYANAITFSVLGPLLSLQDEETLEYVYTTFSEEFKAFNELTNNK